LKASTHQDQLVYKKVNAIAGYKKGWYCNECRSQNKPTVPSYHCDKHNYDLCLDCSQDETGGDAGGDAGGAAGGDAGGDASGDASGDAGGDAGGEE